MSLGADILLKIRSTFESKSVEEAKKKTEEFGKATDKAGKDASSGMNVMAAATALMQGNVNAAIGANANDIDVSYAEPLVCEPGTNFAIILRVVTGAATALQVIAGCVDVRGVFE